MASPDSTPLVLGVAQTVPVAGRVAANLEQHVELAAEAARRDAEVLVFPELSLTGYELSLAPELAFDRDDARLAPLEARARELAMVLVAGLPLRLADRLHIAALAFHPDGRRTAYTKRHLGAFPPETNPGGPIPPPEATVFVAGDEDTLLEVGGARIALAICADTNHASHSAAAARRGANVYAASMFFTPRDADGELARLADVARRHALHVAFANFGGATGGLESAGRSGIFSPQGHELASLPASGPGVAVARVR